MEHAFVVECGLEVIYTMTQEGATTYMPTKSTFESSGIKYAPEKKIVRVWQKSPAF